MISIFTGPESDAERRCCLRGYRLHRNDALHERTVHAYREQGRGRRLTTDAVLIESCNAFSKETLRPLAHALMDKVRVAKNLGILEVVHADEELIRRGFDLFRARGDKDWSLTDCISFVVMKEHAAGKALTSDHHFTQAGFEKLL